MENGIPIKPQNRLRTKSRATAIQVLYHLDLAKNLENPNSTNAQWILGLIQIHFAHFDVQLKTQSFSQSLIIGVCIHKKIIDEALMKHIEHWKLDRISLIDRAILRLAAFEILISQESHPRVVINEAIELAKQYSATESGSFINSVLDKLIKNLMDFHNSTPKNTSNQQSA